MNTPPNTASTDGRTDDPDVVGEVFGTEAQPATASASAPEEQLGTPRSTPPHSGDVHPRISAARSASPTRSREEIAKLRALTYDAYLQTAWWRYARNRALARAGYRCERCAVKRDLQVHHVTYARLGDEADGDLQVLCDGCHLGHHVAEAVPNRGVYLAIASAALKVQSFSSVADLVEEVKCRCAQLKIPYKRGQVQAAIAWLDDARIGVQRVPTNRAALVHEGVGSAPMTRAEAAGWMVRLGAIAKSMPEAEVLTLREAERGKALRILAQGILEQIERCEALEREEPQP